MFVCFPVPWNMMRKLTVGGCNDPFWVCDAMTQSCLERVCVRVRRSACRKAHESAVPLDQRSTAPKEGLVRERESSMCKPETEHWWCKAETIACTTQKKVFSGLGRERRWADSIVRDPWNQGVGHPAPARAPCVPPP